MFYFRLHVYCFVACIELCSAGIKRKSGNSKQYVEIMMNVNVIGNYFLYFPKAWRLILVDSWVQERLGNDGRKLPDFQRNLSILPDACVKMRAISKSYWRLQPMPLMSWCFMEPHLVYRQQIRTAWVPRRHLSSTFPWIQQEIQVLENLQHMKQQNFCYVFHFESLCMLDDWNQ